MARKLADLQERAGGVVSVGATDTVWMVIDPMSKESELADIFGETTLGSLGNQVLGGLRPGKENLVLYIGAGAEAAAKMDAENRLAKSRGRKDDAFFGAGTVTG